MSDTVISVRDIKKRYTLGETVRHDVLRDQIAHAINPRHWTKAARNLAAANPKPKNSRDFWALNGVSFDVQQGEVLGIIGHNGAGKSTLLKILSRITEPTQGRITMKGRVAALLEVGTGFHPELTGRENTYLNGSILGMSKAEVDRKFDQIVDFAGVEQFIDTPVKRYSSGMRVRLGFAIAAHLDPDILIIDEVLAVGDAAFRQRCLQTMQEKSESNAVSTIFVSHDMPSIEAICTKCILMDHGEIQSSGSASEVIQHYNSKAYGDSESDVNGDVVKKIWVEGTEKSQKPTSGRGWAIRIELNAARTIKQPKIGIGISKPDGLRVFTVHTDFTGDSIPSLEARAVLICDLGECDLVAGDYVAKIALDDAAESREVIEKFHFTILPSDIFGSGKTPSSKQGVIWKKASWRLIKTSTAV